MPLNSWKRIREPPDRWFVICLDKEHFNRRKYHQHTETFTWREARKFLHFVLILSTSVRASKKLPTLVQSFTLLNQEMSYQSKYSCESTYLNAEDTKDDEKSATDQHNVPNGFEGWKQCLNHQFQTRSSIDHPKRPQCSNQSKDS